MLEVGKLVDKSISKSQSKPLSIHGLYRGLIIIIICISYYILIILAHDSCPQILHVHDV